MDAEVGRDLAKLARDLDGTVEVANESDDQTLWIVAASRPDRPFAWYLLDRSSGALTKLSSTRPKLDGVVLSPVQAVVVRSRDGLDLVCYLTLPRSLSGAKPHHPLPMVLEVHGGPWARDSWAYNRWVQWYADRGYAVLQVNYRGSTGFGKAFVNAGDREWAGRMHDDLIDAVDGAIGEGVADPKRIAICGGSYGGYAAFVGATFTPDTSAAASPSSASPISRPCLPIRPHTGPPFTSKSVTASAIRAPRKAAPCSEAARHYIGREPSRSLC